MRKARLCFLLIGAVATLGLITMSTGAHAVAAQSTEQYCAVVRQVFVDRPSLLQLDERTTPLETGVDAIDNLRVSLSRVGSSAPSDIAPAYRKSVITLSSLRSAWKQLKKSTSETRRSNARLAFASSNDRLAGFTNEIAGHISQNCVATGEPIATQVVASPSTAQDSPMSTNATMWLAMVNQARSESRVCGGITYPAVAPLVWDTRLEQAALAHSSYQQQIDTMTHTGSGGSSGGQRIAANGFKWSSWGENVGWNYQSAAAMLQGWLNSAGHCTNIMKPVFTHIGWARVGAYDTMDLANLR